MIRTIVFWGLYWGPLILGNYQFPNMEHASNAYLSSGQLDPSFGVLGFPKNFSWKTSFSEAEPLNSEGFNPEM